MRTGPAPRSRAPRLLAVVLLLAALATGCTAPARPAPRRSTARQTVTPPGSSASSDPTRSPPQPGKLVWLPIPGRTSGFTARAAYVYLPPAALGPRPARLPLLELLHGTPGSPSDWATKGGLVAELNTLAAAHSGAAPITVLPDINGSLQGDSECVRAGNADIEEYLTADVPDFVAARYPVLADHRRWSIAGISEGGTCSLMLALRHPGLFPVFGDMSGLARPTVGDSDNPMATIRELFDGSTAAYDRHDPLWLLRQYKYPQLHGWFGYGDAETAVGIDTRAIAGLARRAGMDARVVVVSGRHVWPTWSAAMSQMLPWLWTRMNP